MREPELVGDGHALVVGRLALFLGEEFERVGRPGWSVRREAPLLDDRTAARVGFAPRADVLLRGPSREQIAVEFEVSRADPVANQAKFVVAGAVATSETTLVSMLSSHISRGKRSLCAAFARGLRAHGLPTFQVALLPTFPPDRIQHLNQRASRRELQSLDIEPEIDRVLSIVERRGRVGGHRIHFAGDVADVVANLWAWNDAMEGRAARRWGRRPVQFFVFEPRHGLFAPAKFCAFVPLAQSSSAPPTMTIDLYAALGEQDTRFDGHRAHRHLARALGFDRVRLAAAPKETETAFERWHAHHRERIPRRPDVQLLVPPPWW